MNLKSIIESLEIDEENLKQSLVEGATLLGVAGAIFIGKKVKEKVEKEIENNPVVRNVVKEIGVLANAHKNYVASKRKTTPPIIKIVRKRNEGSDKKSRNHNKEDNK